MSLSDINVGDKAIIKQINSKENIKRRLLDIGLIEGTYVECVLKSIFKDPLAYLIRGAVIAIRKEDSKDILVELVWKK